MRNRKQSQRMASAEQLLYYVPLPLSAVFKSGWTGVKAVQLSAPQMKMMLCHKCNIEQKAKRVCSCFQLKDSVKLTLYFPPLVRFWIDFQR